jgi:probable rRNA maturation factor
VDAPELPRWRLRRWVRHAVEAAAKAGALPRVDTVALALRLVDTDEAQTLNREFRGRDYATNVLTFEYGVDPDATASGDIVLCVPVLHREAAEQGKTVVHHAAHLTVHGVLHALGYDHIEPADAGTMEALETAILASLGIADPYQA